MTAWNILSARAGRVELPYILARAVFITETISDPDDIAVALEDAWVMPEWPASAMETEMWISLFEMTGFLRDGKRGENPPESIRLYRGCVAGKEFGMSWTEDLEKAQWFASRFDDYYGEGRVYETTATSDSILANFTRRGESEWVLDADKISVREYAAE